MACCMEMLAPPVVLVAGSRPVGQLPANAVSSRTVRLPPLTGFPAALEELEELELPPPPQAARTSVVANRRASIIRCLIGAPVLVIVGFHAEAGWAAELRARRRTAIDRGDPAHARQEQVPGRGTCALMALPVGGRQLRRLPARA